MSPSGHIVDYSGKQLNADDIYRCVQKLKEMVVGDLKLKQFRSDCSYLLRFLHCTGFNVDLAFKRIQEYYSHLQEHPEWYASTSPLDKRKTIEESGKAMLLERDKAGRRIFVLKIGEVDASKTSCQEQEQIEEMWMESVLEDPKTQAAGLCFIMDMKGYSLQLFRWLTPSNMRNVTRKSDLYPCKEIIYHMVNISPLVNAGFKLVKPFMSEKTKQSIKFHSGDWSSLHEYISPDVLPPDYGGTAPIIDFEDLNSRLFKQDLEISERLKHQRVVKN